MMTDDPSRLTPTGKPVDRRGQHIFREYRCSCGAIKVIRMDSVASGSIRSCGCLHREVASRTAHARATHGKAGTTIYKIWQGMITRCTNPRNPNFHGYGGRGIAVCDRWLSSFENFYCDMGDRPAGKSLDRRDNNGPYCKENCRWATQAEQTNNTRRNRALSFNGRTMNVSQWADTLGIGRKILHWRIRHGWPVGRALTEPVRN